VTARPTPGAAAGPLRLATRTSPLARWQAERVAALLGADVELVDVTTLGDRRTDVPIHAVGGTGAFSAEVSAAVADGRADLAVHSAKDLPSRLGPGLVLAAVPERADPRDALVGSTLAGLAARARVATGSVRRRAQLAAVRPDLEFHELRGNMGTRLAKAAGFDAIVVAAAAFLRLGWEDRLAEVLPVDVVLPQVGQGALAVEARADDERALAACAAVDQAHLHAAVDAERAFLAELGGGCELPCGALAVADPAGRQLRLVGLLAAPDGSWVVRREEVGAADTPGELGRRVAAAVLAAVP
jgi:hydroxymethylbilane synthase